VIQVPVLANVPMPQANPRVKPAAARTSEHERVQDPRRDRRQDAGQIGKQIRAQDRTQGPQRDWRRDGRQGPRDDRDIFRIIR
jgi:hypothetical protein